MSTAQSPPPSPPSHSKTTSSSEFGSLRSRKSARERRILMSGEDRINRILSSTPNLPNKVEEPHSPPIENEQLLSSSSESIKKKTSRGSRGRATGRRFVPIDQSSISVEENTNGLNLTDISEVKKPSSRPITPIQDINLQQTEVQQPKPQLPTGLEGLEKLSQLFERMQQQQESGSSQTPVQLDGLLDDIDKSETVSPFNNLFAQPSAASKSPSTSTAQSSYIIQFIVGVLLVIYLLFITPSLMDTNSSEASSANIKEQPQYLQMARYLSFSQIQPFYILLTFSIINQTVKLIKYKNERGSKFQHYPSPLKDIVNNLGTVIQLVRGMWDDLTLVIFILGHFIILQSIIVALL
ncbi:hypothetical protein CONCODRAFT_7584 [Conidiobolus coronatus NRRL 28638]|uniref:Uncharacterized protein n=1 Tax=Conidiobolus coronatus (strain ATCC 28846 / CBS 209.66 / NRRL 28638) TaxID=796925 RepID=A0A137P4L1_CONC2|nr:hypothetical protein CONCODRAFT_7584 [Conidiobolus coronatus NRRL 28638]|eukprot:KXN69936.1 hypothetical protein CONCODRAFT_7584 [Conidiobolus coronatus NRRL 28638]